MTFNVDIVKTFQNTKTIQLDLVQGWNTISLFKQGTAEDDPSWGGYVMLDYLKIKDV